MTTTPITRELFLAFAFTKPILLLGTGFVDAAGTADTETIMFRAFITGRDRPTAGVALIVRSLTKMAIEGDSLIEDKALARPTIMGCINVGQIVQNPAI